RQPFAGGDGRGGGGGVEVTDAAGGEQHRTGGDDDAVAVRGDQLGAGDATFVAAQRDHGVVREDRGLVGAGGLDERPLDLGAGRVTAGVDHPERAVPALPAAGQTAGGGDVEDGAALPQPAHDGR